MIQVIIETIKINGLNSCYVRPLVYRGHGELGISPLHCPVHCMVAVWPWGSYLGQDALKDGVSVCVSSWNRPAANTLPSMAKAVGNYLSSQLMKIEAVENGYDEAIALDHDGYVSEGSGENIFIVRNGVIYTPPSSASILPGITRHCVFILARELGIRIHRQAIPREALYISDEVFFSGTAAEITPVAKVDNIVIGNGSIGPITKRIQSKFFKIVKGEDPEQYDWFTPIF